MNKFWKIVERIANGYSSPTFVGRGRLVPYKDKSDSWILNQMKQKKVDKGISVVDKGSDKKFKTNGAE